MKRGGMDIDKVVAVVMLARKTGAEEERARCLAIVRAYGQLGGEGGYDAIESAILSGEGPPRLIEFSDGKPEPWIVEHERREAEGSK